MRSGKSIAYRVTTVSLVETKVVYCSTDKSEALRNFLAREPNRDDYIFVVIESLDTATMEDGFGSAGSIVRHTAKSKEVLPMK